MNKEEWKPIKDYENLYEASNTGKIRSLSRKVIVKNKYGAISTRMTKPKELKPQNKGQYSMIWLCKNGKCKQYTIHKIIAETFIKNPNNFSQVNHKNENRYDNRV